MEPAAWVAIVVTIVTAVVSGLTALVAMYVSISKRNSDMQKAKAETEALVADTKAEQDITTGTQISKQNDTIAGLLLTQAGFVEQVSAVNGKLVSALVEVVELRAKAESAEKRAVAAEARALSAEEKTAAIQVDLDGLKVELTASREQNAPLLTEVAALKQQLKESNDASTKRAELAETELAQLKLWVPHRIEALEDVIKRLEGKPTSSGTEQSSLAELKEQAMEMKNAPQQPPTVANDDAATEAPTPDSPVAKSDTIPVEE